MHQHRKKKKRKLTPVLCGYLGMKAKWRRREIVLFNP